MKISDVQFRDYNNQDNLYFSVENLDQILKSTPIYSNQKELDGGTLWVKIYKGGIAIFGYTLEHDPLHGNQKYTWSSNSSCINREFNLYGTPYQLAEYGAGIKEASKDGGCYWAGEITTELALSIAEANQEKLHYGLEKFKKTHFESF